MTTTAWKEQILSSRKTCTVDRPALTKQLWDARHKLAKQIRRMGLEKNDVAKREAIQKLDFTYYSNWLSSKYPLVDLSFAGATQDLLLRRTEGGVEIIGRANREPNAPVEITARVAKYAQQVDRWNPSNLAESLPDPQHILGRIVFPTFQKDRARYRAYAGNVMCNRPEGSPKSLKRKLCDIRAISLEAQASAIRAGIGVTPAHLTRLFLWEPLIEDLYIEEQISVRADPAVIVKIGERAHLVAFWDSPDESPIEGVLREFTEGSLENVK